MLSIKNPFETRYVRECMYRYSRKQSLTTEKEKQIFPLFDGLVSVVFNVKSTKWISYLSAWAQLSSCWDQTLTGCVTRMAILLPSFCCAMYTYTDYRFSSARLKDVILIPNTQTQPGLFKGPFLIFIFFIRSTFSLSSIVNHSKKIPWKNIFRSRSLFGIELPQFLFVVSISFLMLFVLRLWILNAECVYYIIHKRQIEGWDKLNKFKIKANKKSQ